MRHAPPEHADMVESVLQWYREGSEHVDTYRDGAAWYTAGRRYAQQLAREFGVSDRRAAGIIAALSPRMQWGANKNAARAVLDAATSGKACPLLGLGLSRQRAWRIANGERPLDVLRGPKTRAFYRNLCGDLSHVTVDIWAVRAAGLTTHPTEHTYPLVAAAYRAVADIVQAPPAIVQAVTWCAIRGKAA